MTHKLEFDSIEVSFGDRRILSGIYMLCETGKITGLLGRNGCGKSTLMKIVFGSMPFEQKSVRINGESLGVDYVSHKRIAYLPQTNLIPSYLRVREALALFDVDSSAITQIFPEAAELMHLRPSQLSGGYLRIFEVMLILNSKANFCLLDEPFTGLTPIYIDKIKRVLAEVKKTKGIIISDHMYRHVAEMSESLYLLANGRTYQVRDQEQLISLGYVNSL